MSEVLVIGVILIISITGVYQIYLDTKDKKKSNCPCGGNCKCNEQKINLR